MLKIKILKSGKYAIHPAWGGIIDFKEGDKYSEGDVLVDVEGKRINANDELNIFTREVALEMEANKWAKLTDKKQKEKEPEPEKDPLSELHDILKDVKEEREKKAIIQDWASVNHGIKPTKSKNVENMILEIKEHISSID
jgi:tryptophanyl-tRNA synthetase